MFLAVYAYLSSNHLSRSNVCAYPPLPGELNPWSLVLDEASLCSLSLNVLFGRNHLLSDIVVGPVYIVFALMEFRGAHGGRVQPDECWLRPQENTTDPGGLGSKTWSCSQPLACKHLHFRVSGDSCEKRRTGSIKETRISYFLSAHWQSRLHGARVETRGGILICIRICLKLGGT